MSRLEQQRPGKAPIVIEGGLAIVPYIKKGQTLRIGLTAYQDHGRLAFHASSIGGNDTLVKHAKKLSHEQSETINNRAATELERLLEGGNIRSEGVLTSDEPGRPNIHIVIFDSFNESSPRIYCHPGKYMSAPLFIRDAVTTNKNANEVEEVFKREGGYKASKNWKRNRTRSRS